MSLKQVVAAYLARKADALVGADTAFFEQTLHPQFTYVNTRGSKLNKLLAAPHHVVTSAARPV